MLNPQHDFLLQQIAKHRARDLMREAEIDRLLHPQHPREPSWWSRQARMLLQYLGQALTSLGRRLENLERPEARSVREQDVIGTAAPRL